MTSQEKDIETLIPDLRDLPAGHLAELGSSALAHSLAVYRERLRENGVPLSSFRTRTYYRGRPPYRRLCHQAVIRGRRPPLTAHGHTKGGAFSATPTMAQAATRQPASPRVPHPG
jgi:hypothetical protein